MILGDLAIKNFCMKKLNDLSAALTLAQFKKINEKKEKLIHQYKLYKEKLLGIKEINLFPLNWGEIPLWIDAEVKNRGELNKFLMENNIFCRDAWPALHRNPPYKNSGKDEDFPNSSYASDNVIWFPNGPAINDEDIIFVCSKIREFYLNGYNPL